jgi:predicted CXXCH cytochrome family protein
MYMRGIACFDCHDVHGSSNYAQLRKPAQHLCLDCHGPQSPNGPRTATIEEHTHHKKDSAGSECIACHMPQIETEGPLNTLVRSHTFKFITPSLTAKYKIPNPCNSCHVWINRRNGPPKPSANGVSGRLGATTSVHPTGDGEASEMDWLSFAGRRS